MERDLLEKEVFEVLREMCNQGMGGASTPEVTKAVGDNLGHKLKDIVVLEALADLAERGVVLMCDDGWRMRGGAA